MKDDEHRRLLITLLLLYALGRVFQLFPGRIPGLVIVVFHVVPAALFAVAHGRRSYRARGILVFMILCLGVGASAEILSLWTGFPFGHYEFTGLMGPKVLDVPVFLALAYVGMGYLSWALAVAILNTRDAPLRGSNVVVVPLVASFAMVAWDLSMDPVWANIDRAWIWRDGGAYFGVPVSNFLGWYLTVYFFYQLFALYLSSRPTLACPEAYSRWAILFYAASALGNFLIAVPTSMPRIIVDASGRSWTVSGILWASRVVSIFLMMPLAALAWTRTSAPGAQETRLVAESGA